MLAKVSKSCIACNLRIIAILTAKLSSLKMSYIFLNSMKFTQDRRTITYSNWNSKA